MCGRYAMGMAIDHIPQALNESVFNPGSKALLEHSVGSTYETTSHVYGHSATIQINVVDSNYTPSYNIPPTSKGVIVYLDQTDKYDYKYNIEPSSFGLLPEWAKKNDSSPVKRGAQTGSEYSREIQRHQAKYFNCRKETLSQDKSVWDLPLKHRRCVVPIQGYFEWLDSRHGKTPYFVYSDKSPVMYLAGLFSHNTNYNDTEMVDGMKYFSSFSIVTGPAQGEGSNDLSWLHIRKPLFIEPNSKAWFEWLGNEDLDKSSLIEDCLKSTKNPVYDGLSWHTVGKSVGNPQNKGVEVTKEEKVKQASITSFFAPKKEKRSFKEEENGKENGKNKVKGEVKDGEVKKEAGRSPKRLKVEVVGSENMFKKESEQETDDSDDE